ncbi:MAG: PilZ domain-containing protein [Thermodesulfobacteriota bacterium]
MTASPSSGSQRKASQESGYEKIASRRAIEKTLSGLAARHTPLVIVHPGYQSGPTILIAMEPDSLELDRPRDWPGKADEIRVVFRSPAQLWSYFPVQVRSVSSQSLFTSFPTYLSVLQRRDNYRVPVPRGSVAAFQAGQQAIDACSIVNVSLGGMLVSMSKTVPLAVGQPVTGIRCRLAGEGSVRGQGPPPVEITVASGVVVRLTASDCPRHYGLGVRFVTDRRVEAALERYIRKRELELLGRGVRG